MAWDDDDTGYDEPITNKSKYFNIFRFTYLVYIMYINVYSDKKKNKHAFDDIPDPDNDDDDITTDNNNDDVDDDDDVPAKYKSKKGKKQRPNTPHDSGNDSNDSNDNNDNDMDNPNDSDNDDDVPDKYKTKTKATTDDDNNDDSDNDDDDVPDKYKSKTKPTNDDDDDDDDDGADETEGFGDLKTNSDISSFVNNVNRDEQNKNELQSWLTSIGMIEYYENFKDYGYYFLNSFLNFFSFLN